MADKSPLQLQQEALEIERRLTQVQLAASDLDAFAEYTFPGYDSAPHQKLLSEHLMQVEKYITSGGKEGIGRLLVEMPPRHGKSEKATIRFPSFFFGRNPDMKVILTSYSDAKAQHYSRQIRECIEGERFQEVFGRTSLSKEKIEINPEGRSVESWTLLKRRGELNAAGIGGGITGKGADLLIIDDPVKGRQDADSMDIRQTAKDWYGAVAYTRLEPHGAIVMCLTRWHKDDLAGHVLSLDDGWTRLRLPALAEENDPLHRKPGQALWESKWGLDALSRTRKNLPTRDWNALYQQNPTDEEGDVFNMNWFTYGDFPPEEEIVQGFQIVDTAFTEDEENDPSAILTLYVTTWGVFIADVWEGHLEFNDLEKKIAEKYLHWNKKRHISRVFVEYKGSGISIVQTLRKKLKEIPILEVKPDSEYGKSKLARAQSITGYLESGNVQFQRNAVWLPKFEDQLTSFPRGKHDDMCFVAGTMIETAHGKVPIENIRVGDMVWTRSGLRKVICSGETGEKDVLTIEFSDGNILQATGNHPVFIDGKGFVRLDSLVYGDTIFSWSKYKSLMALDSGGIPIVNGSTTDGTSKLIQKIRGPSFIYTDTFGRRRMERFLEKKKSIIKMGIQQITESRIFVFFRYQSIESFMHVLIKNISKGLGILQLSGIEVKVAGNGISPMQRMCGKPERDIKERVKYVGKNIKHPFQREVDTAPVFVSRVRGGGKKKVYNLSVDKDHEYFANGVLVHNCDVFVYGIMRVQGGAKKKKNNEPYWVPDAQHMGRHDQILGVGFFD